MVTRSLTKGTATVSRRTVSVVPEGCTHHTWADVKHPGTGEPSIGVRDILMFSMLINLRVPLLLLLLPDARRREKTLSTHKTPLCVDKVFYTQDPLPELARFASEPW